MEKCDRCKLLDALSKYNLDKSKTHTPCEDCSKSKGKPE